MAQCKASTKAGRRCFNVASSGRKFCHVHRKQGVGEAAKAVAVGAFLGSLVAPGVGTVVGATAGGLVNGLFGEDEEMKKKVFVSFDFDNDKKLKDFIIGQSKNSDSPFEVVDHSLKEAAPERNWETKADRAIGRSEIVIVMVGPQTYRAHGVLKEVRMARERDKKIVQLIGYRDGDYKPVPNAGRLYRWNWENLKKLLS